MSQDSMKVKKRNVKQKGSKSLFAINIPCPLKLETIIQSNQSDNFIAKSVNEQHHILPKISIDWTKKKKSLYLSPASRRDDIEMTKQLNTYRVPNNMPNLSLKRCQLPQMSRLKYGNNDKYKQQQQQSPFQVKVFQEYLNKVDKSNHPLSSNRERSLIKPQKEGSKSKIKKKIRQQLENIRDTKRIEKDKNSEQMNQQNNQVNLENDYINKNQSCILLNNQNNSVQLKSPIVTLNQNTYAKENRSRSLISNNKQNSSMILWDNSILQKAMSIGDISAFSGVSSFRNIQDYPMSIEGDKLIIGDKQSPLSLINQKEGGESLLDKPQELVIKNYPLIANKKHQEQGISKNVRPFFTGSEEKQVRDQQIQTNQGEMDLESFNSKIFDKKQKFLKNLIESTPLLNQQTNYNSFNNQLNSNKFFCQVYFNNLNNRPNLYKHIINFRNKHYENLIRKKRLNDELALIHPIPQNIVPSSKSIENATPICLQNEMNYQKLNYSKLPNENNTLSSSTMKRYNPKVSNILKIETKSPLHNDNTLSNNIYTNDIQSIEASPLEQVIQCKYRQQNNKLPLLYESKRVLPIQSERLSVCDSQANQKRNLLLSPLKINSQQPHIVDKIVLDWKIDEKTAEKGNQPDYGIDNYIDDQRHMII